MSTETLTSEEAARDLRAGACVSALDGVKRPKVYREKVDQLVRATHGVLRLLTEQGAGAFSSTRELVRAVAAVEAEQGS